MKLYGLRRKDRGCCPGHDKFPRETYRSRRSKKAHRDTTKVCHRNGRARLKVDTMRQFRQED